MVPGMSGDRQLKSPRMTYQEMIILERDDLLSVYLFPLIHKSVHRCKKRFYVFYLCHVFYVF